jgi:DASS family divalent anion:Na+ symporter
MKEWIMGGTFFGMILLWAFSPVLNINLAIVAFMGLSILILAKVYTIEDIREGGGDALETYIWFAILYMISTALNDMGFMKTGGVGTGKRFQNSSLPVTDFRDEDQ